MPGLSKSKFVTFCQCPKALWLKVNHPELEVVDDQTQRVLDQGNKVGDLAMGLFGPFVDVTVRDASGNIDKAAMVEATQAELDKGTTNICEASFLYDDLFCSVDILHKTAGGYAIYEVKSTTDPRKHMDVYCQDVAFQKYLVEHCGLTVTDTYLVYLNNQYVRGKKLDIHGLFNIMDITGKVGYEYARVEDNLKMAKAVLEGDEPEGDFPFVCNKPYNCGFFSHCSRHLPKPNVFDLYCSRDKLVYYRNGVISFADLLSEKLSMVQKIQVECTLKQTQHIATKGINDFLGTLSYPLYFLDFETFNPAIPAFEGTRPYQQIPFQYSLHYYDKKGGTLQHKEYIDLSGNDPRRGLAEQLCKDIPMDVCVLAYYDPFECGRIKELAEAFPDLKRHLMNIYNNIKDLLDPFKGGMCYVPAMGGSFSIKSVLPALYPNDPSLDYSNLSGSVHHGGQAIDAYEKAIKMNPIDRSKVEKDLLEYCKLDTFAMVKVLEKLEELAR